MFIEHSYLNDSCGNVKEYLDIYYYIHGDLFITGFQIRSQNKNKLAPKMAELKGPNTYTWQTYLQHMDEIPQSIHDCPSRGVGATTDQSISRSIFHLRARIESLSFSSGSHVMWGPVQRLQLLRNYR